MKPRANGSFSTEPSLIAPEPPDFDSLSEGGCRNNKEPTIEQCNNCDAPDCPDRLNNA